MPREGAIEVASKGTSTSDLSAIEINTDSKPLNSVEVSIAEYTGGIVPEAMRLEIRDAYQTAGITQAQAAELLGLSRPHFANALAGRYSLSKARVVKLHEFLAQPPPIVAPRLL